MGTVRRMARPHRRLGYRLNLNVYDHKSKITKFNNLSGSIDNYYVGKALNSIYGYRADGYYSIDDFDMERPRSALGCSRKASCQSAVIQCSLVM